MQTKPAPAPVSPDHGEVVRALDRVIALLRRYATGEDEPVAPHDPHPDSALARLTRAFGLSAFERDVLMLSATPELDGSAPALIGSAVGKQEPALPTLSLALAAFEDAEWSAFRPDASLRFWRLIDVEGPSLTAGIIRTDEAILHELLGFPCDDRRLAAYLGEPLARTRLSPSQDAFVAELATALQGSPTTPIQLVGPDRVVLESLSATICSSLGTAPLVLRCADLPGDAHDRTGLLRLIERTAILRGSIVVLPIDDDGQDPQRLRYVRGIVQARNVPVLILASRRLDLGRGVIVRHAASPTRDEQARAWNQRLAARGHIAAADAAKLAQQFNLDLGTIHSAAESATEEVQGPRDAARAHVRTQLEALAQQVPTHGVRWRDLVLPTEQRHVLRQVLDHITARAGVYRDWGVAADEAGAGMTVLFSGASGTGKSMAARVLARQAGLDLFRIDLAEMVSKYIGETEKNLRAVFDAADRGGVALLFDEADALFGKRSDVRDSHDRHANIEVSYLLQRLERFTGVSFLTTNLRSSIDEAFLRRFAFAVEFPFPDERLRERLWRRAFAGARPTAIEPAVLARLPIAGGNIRNIALNAAVRAAARGRSVGAADIVAAVRAEYAKLDRGTQNPELARWLDGLRR